jgi:polar amino acid transport system substrate-binding protein
MRRIFVALVLAVLSACPSFGQSTIRLARIADIPDQIVGGEILRVIYARLNITVEFEDVPGKRALVLSSAGVLDGEVHRIAGLSRNLPTLIQLSPAINFIEPTVFTTALRFEVAGWPSIAPYSVGIVRGVGSSERGTAGMPMVTAASNLENLIRMLNAGRVDLFVTDLFSGQVAVRRLNLHGRIYPLLPPLDRIEIFHYLHERHRDLTVKVEAVIADMASTGELAHLRGHLVKHILDMPQ